MKICAFILSIIVLVLSSLPCADAASVSNDRQQKHEAANQTDQQSHDGTDECSPFCHCGCCAGFSINHTLAVVIQAPSYSTNHSTSFLPSQVIEITLPIWQPPRLV